MALIEFHMLAQSLETDNQFTALDKKIQDAVKPDNERTKTLIATLAILLSCTKDITFNFDDTANDALLYFREWWSRRNALSPLELWESRKRIAHSIMAEWDTEFGRAQNVFFVPTEQRPKSHMSAEERTEAEAPNSPLAAA